MSERYPEPHVVSGNTATCRRSEKSSGIQTRWGGSRLRWTAAPLVIAGGSEDGRGRRGALLGEVGAQEHVFANVGCAFSSHAARAGRVPLDERQRKLGT